MFRRAAGLAGLLLMVLGGVAPAAAQPFETVGTRALGMGGAFVAVVNDATAVYWNPAGLPEGPLLSLVLDRQTAERTGPGDVLDGGLQQEHGSTFFGAGTLPLAVTSYQLWHYSARLIPPQAVGPTRPAELTSLETRHFGVTVVQSLGQPVTVGATVKYVRGSAASQLVTLAEGADPIEEAERLDRRSGNAFDLDLGVLATIRRIRLGLVVRNTLEPSFETHFGDELVVERQVRVGLAIGPTDNLTLALDADLTRSDPRPTGEMFTAFEERQSIAAGAEQWFLRRRAALRAGARIDVHDTDYRTYSWGGTVFLTARIAAEWQQSGGPDRAEKGWGIGGRFSY
jgi:F plasmid transfer operon, TraF, protein